MFNYKIVNNQKIYEQHKLSISNKKIIEYINWNTKNKLSEILLPTFDWYEAFLNKENMKNKNKVIVKKFLNIDYRE